MQKQASILPLIIKGLGFDAGGKNLLLDMDITLPKAGITAIIGPNGAGKSLFLRLCHGLITPTRGQVIWHARPDEIANRKRHMMVFQHPLMLRRSVQANVMHALQAAGAADAQNRARFALDRFGLLSLAEQPARLLSGGEKQRVALARAWALEPEVMFLDEPTSQLDPGATRQIEEIILTMAAEGMTIVMATHDLGQARRLSQRIVFMHRGRLIEDASSDRFFASPKTAEARAFIAGDLLW